MSNQCNFKDIVKKIETGTSQEVIDIINQSEAKERIITARDDRDDSIPEYCYRYRPIKRRGLTLLHYAMIYGTPEVVQHLLGNDADPMAKNDPEGQQLSVIHIPCYLGKIETLKALLNSSKIEKRTKEKLVNDACTIVNKDGSTCKWTPIHYACGANNQDVLMLLLEFEAVPFNCGGFGYACKVSNSGIVEILVTKFKDVIHKHINKIDEFDKTPLQQCQKNSCSKTVELLLSNGADPTIEDMHKKNSLYYAIRHCNEACVLKMLHSKQLTRSGIQKFFTEEIALMCIENALPLVLSKLLQLFNLAQKTGKIMKCLLHKVMLGNAVDLEVFSQVVKYSGKSCIEEEDKEGKTPMLLAASLNLHKELSILYTTYLEILEDNFFFYKKKDYQSLYTDIVAKKDSKGLGMAHLAVQCRGSDSDFEDTVRIVTYMWKRLEDIFSQGDTVIQGENVIQDPFLMEAMDSELGRNVSPVQLACKTGQPERILPILEVTKARSLFHCDEDIIHWALNYGMQIVDFEKLCSLIVMVLHDSSDVLKKIFNIEVDKETPLHLAFKKKQFEHVKIMLRLKFDDGQDIVHFKNGDSSTLKKALIHSVPRDIMKDLLERIKKDEWRQFPLVTHSESKPQIDLPVSVTKADAIHNVLEEASELFNQEQYATLEKLLNDSVDHKRIDIFEMVTVNHKVIFKSTLHKILFDGQIEEFVRIAIRYSKFSELVNVLTSVIPDLNTTYFNELIKKMPEVAMEALNRSWDSESTKTLLQHPKELKKGYPLPQFSRSGQEVGMEDMINCGEIEEPRPTNDALTVTHPLDVMVETQQKELLQHPLVKEYLNSQWLAGAFWVYCIQIILYLCFIGFFSSLVLNLRHPSDSTCNSSMKENSSTANIDDQRIILGLSILSVLFMILQGIFPIVNTILYLKHKYPLKGMEVKSFILSAPEIWLQIPTAIFTLFFVGKSIEISIDNTCHGNESWTFGVFAIILAWTNLTLILYKFPVIGHYALVFAAICWTFFQLMFFAIFLLLASTVVLHMIFYNPLAPYSPFSNFGDGVAMVISMITGDYGYQDSFGLSFSPEFTRDYELYDRNMANLIWILFVVLIPILLSNMLTSLAVGDTNEILRNADIRKLELKVKWVTGNQKHSVPKCCIEIIERFSKIFISETEAKAEESSKNEYKEKLRNDKKEIEKKYSEIPRESDTEVLETVKEVTKRNQSKLRDIKIIHDKALNRLHKGQAQLKEQLQSH